MLISDCNRLEIFVYTHYKSKSHHAWNQDLANSQKDLAILKNISSFHGLLKGILKVRKSTTRWQTFGSVLFYLWDFIPHSSRNMREEEKNYYLTGNHLFIFRYIFSSVLFVNNASRQSKAMAASQEADYNRHQIFSSKT